jgi:hypothetical protein
MGVMALLYGKGDFKTTLSIATSAGLDSDNQPATLGGLIGIMRGASRLPKDDMMIFTEGTNQPFYGVHVNHTRDGLPERTKISDIVARIADIAEIAILENGGEVKKLPGGDRLYVIKTDF